MANVAHHPPFSNSDGIFSRSCIGNPAQEAPKAQNSCVLRTLLALDPRASTRHKARSREDDGSGLRGVS